MKKTVLIIIAMWYLLSANTTFAFTHADTLRGSNGRGRSWWDVQKYGLFVTFDTAKQAIQGWTKIEFSVVGQPIDSMQIDLQDPMVIDSVFFDELYVDSTRETKNTDPIWLTEYIHTKRTKLKVTKDGNVWWAVANFQELLQSTKPNLKERYVWVCYHGTPRNAVNPPWDGGFSWRKDSTGKPWIAVSCQGLGASAWWPCKDAQWDEPDSGMDIVYTVPKGLTAVGNGEFKKTWETDTTISWQWKVNSPINNYDVSFYIGDYVHLDTTFDGEKGSLDVDFWVLRQNEQRARKQFAVVPKMLECFEYWMGPYPFYEDGYKLVDAPYLGMEHQSAVAYGNGYQMGYLGYDRTGTGIGMNFDYIIVHESGHEWFGNNVTAKDMADNWVHEGITTYSESLFEECLTNKEKGQAYCRGEWRNIRNDKPIIGPYGVNEEGSGDMYDKGAAIMYMIRQLTNDDEKFRQMLRGLGKEFYHQTVTTQQVETYIATHTGLELKAFFDQYLRTADIPVLEYSIKHKQLRYRFSNVVPGFTLPITARAGKNIVTLQPTTEWQTMKWTKGYNIKFSKDFLIEVK